MTVVGLAAYALVRVWVSWTDPASSEVTLEPGITVESGSGGASLGTTVAPLVLTWSPAEGFGAAARVDVEYGR